MDYFHQETERLQMRKLSVSDIEPWSVFFKEFTLLELLGMKQNADAEAMAHEWITRQLERYDGSGLGHLAVVEKYDNQFTGMAGVVNRILEGEEVYELAYSLLPKFWGNGYATEAVLQLKKYALLKFGDKSIISMIHRENEASKTVAQRVGFSKKRMAIYEGIEVEVWG